MKTVLINCSPKKRFCASAYLLRLQRFWIKGKKVTEQLRNRNDYGRILQELKDADQVVFCLPLYIDAQPSHVMAFLEVMEQFCKENTIHLRLYSISNGGFIEGNQNEPLLQIFRNFCTRCDLEWCGGIGIGGGVMLNVTRIVFIIQIGILFLNILLSGIQYGDFLPVLALKNFAEQALTLLFFNLGVLFYVLQMGMAINKGRFFGKRYTRILIPSFLFIPIADLFFLLISTVKGGLFHGWLAKK